MAWWWRKPDIPEPAVEPAVESPPRVELKGAEVSVSNDPTPPDKGERHSRLWVQFLTGAVEMLEEEVSRGIGDIAEKQAQIADKKRQIAIHTAMHPDDSRDAEHMQAHLDSVRPG